MRPPLTWADLSGRRVGVWGLGVEGRASVARLSEMGIVPVLVDDSDREFDDLHVLTSGSGGLDALGRCDVVVKTPAISRHSPEVRRLVAAGVAVVGGLGLWLAGKDRSAVVCITGTKGKSTTTAIAGHLLVGLGRRPFLGGNFGAPPWHPDVIAKDHDLWIVETSSYQAADLEVSPPVVAVTSLHQDHLDWHAGDPETYYRDKLSMCRRPGADLTVANGDSDLLRERRSLLGPRVKWVGAADPAGPWLDAMGLLGAHNRRNALLAAACIHALGVEGADDEGALLAAAGGFAGLNSRLKTVGEAAGVTFVDDSLSTNVLSTVAALDAFPGRRVALIVGGHDRHIDYKPLALAIRDRAAPTRVVTLPDSGPRIRRVIEAVPGAPAVADYPDLGSAVRAAYAWAIPDGIVLLSPAASSFGQFVDYKDRAAAFLRTFQDCARGWRPARAPERQG